MQLFPVCMRVMLSTLANKKLKSMDAFKAKIRAKYDRK